MKFLTFDFNGWFDRILDQNGKERALGFRSCLYKHQDQWLVGAQALAAARFANSTATIDAIDALANAAGGYGPNSLEQGKTSTLPSALWKLVEAVNCANKETIHLALIVPDDHFFGTPKVVQEGKTRLEILYNSLYSARQSSGLMRSRIELVWRSVAVLQAGLKKHVEKLKDQEGNVLVVSINKKICWRVLELRRWPRDDKGKNPICIERTPINVSKNDSKMGESAWMEDLLTRVENQNSVNLEKLSQWTRYMEILVTNASSKTLNQFDIDENKYENAIEHRTWPTDREKSLSWRTEAPIVVPKNYAKKLLLKKLKEIIEKFLSQQKKPLAVIIENPFYIEQLDKKWQSRLNLDDKIQIYDVSGADTTRAAACLANVLAESNHPRSPAWLDSVPEIRLKVREKLDDGHGGSNTKWRPVVFGNKVVPAGEIYSTRPSTRRKDSRRVTLAPGIEYVHLHLRRGGEGAWDERYTQPAIVSSDHERVVEPNAGSLVNSAIWAIIPSDRKRVVEPLARVRPLSEVARIEIVEHLPNGEVEALAGSTSGIKWDDLMDKPPPELGSIPELYIFEASEVGWENLKPILEQIVESERNGDDYSLRNALRDKLYKCTQEQWKSRKFPLGSDGQPPRTSNGQDYIAAQQLLRDARSILVRDLKYCVDRQIKLKVGVANRLHMGLTWLFTGCPEEVTNILLDATVNPDGQAGKTLHMDNDYSAWSIYSGVGRTVRSEESLKIIYDTLIGRWENKGGQQQDKFLLAAVSHPLARRSLVRKILNEDKKRFQRLKQFLCQQLDNIIENKHDSRPSRKHPSLELRYVIMGYRGLCQIRYKNPEWFPVNGSGRCDANKTDKKLEHLKNLPRFRNKEFEQTLLELSAPYLVGEGEDPTMPGAF